MTAMMYIRLMFVILALFPFMAFAQAGDVPFNGVVVDANGVGIARAKVAVLGSAKYTTTDKMGRFGLTNIGENSTFILSVKGVRDMTLDVGSRKSLKIVINGGEVVDLQDSKEIEDAGWGFVKRRENISAGMILGEDLRRSHQTDLELALLARVPGLMKINGELTIRGVSSVNSSSQALILVDGTEVPSLASVSILEVESVQVIKSASSYGVRGANGVISIKLRSR